MLKSIALVLVALASLSSLSAVRAQCASWTPGFHGGGADNPIRTYFVHDDGSGSKLYAGGDFTVIGGAVADHVARFDGTAWSSVGAGFNDTVLAFAEFQGQLYAGGQFWGALYGIARWNGTSWVPVGGGVDGSVNALAVFGGELYVGGWFSHAGGVPADNIARWNGTSWSAVGPGLPGNAGVDALLAVDLGGGTQLYASGQFIGRAASWDGASWTAMTVSPMTRMWTLAAYDEGQGLKLFAGADSGALRWTGSVWQPVVGLTNHGRVRRLMVHDDGGGAQLYAAGEFSVPPLDHIARWNGSVWSGVGNGTGADDNVTALGEFDDGSGHGDELWVGGRMASINGDTAPKLAAWDGAHWRVPGAGQGINALYPGVDALIGWNDGVHSRSVLAAGGSFTRAGSTPANNVAVWDGANWSELSSGTDGLVRALATGIDPATGVDSLYVGGSFMAAGGVNSRGVARWDGSAWSALGSGVDGDAWAMLATDAPQLGGPALFVGGAFASASGLPANSIARWDGSTWHALGSGLTIAGNPSGIHALIVWDDPGSPAGPELFVGGAFNTAGNVASWWAARWDGIGWSAMDNGLIPLSPGAITGFAIFNAGAGDELFAVDAANHLLRWTGSTWSPVPGAPGQLGPLSMLVHDDGTGPAIYTAWSRWNGVGWSSLGQPLDNGVVYAYASLSSGPGGPSALWVGGQFNGVADVASTNIARWTDPCASLTRYCTAKTNSLGCVPAIAWSGEPSVTLTAATPFVVSANQVINERTGLFFYGTSGRRSAPFQGGTMCVRAPTQRTPVRSSGGSPGAHDCSGVFSIDFSPWIQGTLDPALTVGTLVEGQWWYRDPPSPGTTGLSDALEFELRP